MCTSIFEYILYLNVILDCLFGLHGLADPWLKGVGWREEWQDKLKYFLAHRPHAFRLDDGEKLTVRLVENRDEEQLQFYLRAYDTFRAACDRDY